jgi:hypothetical protein
MNKDRDLKSYLDEYYLLPFERYAETYRRKAVLKTLQALRPKSLIEVGCGKDSIFNHLDSSVVGTIIEPIVSLTAKQDLVRHLPRVKVINSLFEEVEVGETEPAEVVLLSSILHEVSDAKLLIETSSKFLKSNGAIVLVVPNAWSIHRFVGERKKIISSLEEQSDTQRKMQQKQQVYSPDSLMAFLENCGFVIEEIRTFFPKLTSHPQMQHLLDAQLVDDSFLDRLYDLSEFLEPTGSEIIAIAKRKND